MTMTNLKEELVNLNKNFISKFLFKHGANSFIYKDRQYSIDDLKNFKVEDIDRINDSILNVNYIFNGTCCNFDVREFLKLLETVVNVFKTIKVVIDNKNEITFDNKFLRKVNSSKQPFSVKETFRLLLLICLHQELITFNNGEYELRYNRKVNAVK